MLNVFCALLVVVEKRHQLSSPIAVLQVFGFARRWTHVHVWDGQGENLWTDGEK